MHYVVGYYKEYHDFFACDKFIDHGSSGWLCGYVAMWLCGYVAMWLCGYVAMWLCGYVAGSLNAIQLSSIQFNHRSVSSQSNQSTGILASVLVHAHAVDLRKICSGEKLAKPVKQEDILYTRVSIASVIYFRTSRRGFLFSSHLFQLFTELVQLLTCFRDRITCRV